MAAASNMASSAPRILFDQESGGTHWIYSTSPAGTDQRRLAAGRDARWSPDRQSIAFTSGRAGSFSIFTISADGSSLTQLTFTGDADLNPSWSPDGHRIAFARIRPRKDGAASDRRRAIMVMDRDGANVEHLTHEIGGAYAAAAWHPDGSRIAFPSNRSGKRYEIFTIGTNGTDVAQLTRTPGDGVSGGHVDWSPNGRQILFTSVRGGEIDVYSIDADGRSETRLTNDSGLIQAGGRWSPDGSQIVFHATLTGAFEDVISTSEIYIMDSDGSDIRQVTDSKFSNAHPDW